MTCAWRLRTCSLLAGLALWSCGGADPTKSDDTASIASLTLPDSAVVLSVGNTIRLAATALRRDGTTQPAASVSWSSSDTTVASISSSGLVTAIAGGRTVITASTGAVRAVAQVTVATLGVNTIAVSDTLPALLPGDTARVSGTAFAGNGSALPEWPVRFSVEDSSVVTVTRDGLVRARAPGVATITARADTVAVTRTVQVVAGSDLQAVGLTLVQSVQNDAGTIPLIRDGLPVLASLYVTSDVPVRTRARAVVTCRTATGTVWTDSASITRVLPSELLASQPAAQLLMPAARLTADLSCDGRITSDLPALDRDSSNNRYPRTGTVTASVMDLPPLELAFVPIVTGATMVEVSPGVLAGYAARVRAVMPVSRLVTRLTTPLIPSRPFFSYAEEEWYSLLLDLAGKRVLEGNTGYLQGLVPVPDSVRPRWSGFATLGGYSAAVIAAQTTRGVPGAAATVAHELGHNFGRQHAPCGNPPFPDDRYPDPTGAIGVIGWDPATPPLFGTQRATHYGRDAKDFMSYCGPAWISEYGFRQAVFAQQLRGGVLRATAQRVVLVRALLPPNGGRATVDALVTDGVASEAAPDGVPVELLDGDGAVLVQVRVAAQPTDHGRMTVLVGAIPIPTGSKPAVAVRILAAGSAPHRVRIDPPSAVHFSVLRQGGGTEIRWDTLASRTAVVRAADGAVLSFARGGRVHLPTVSRVTLSFSNGTRVERQ